MSSENKDYLFNLANASVKNSPNNENKFINYPEIGEKCNNLTPIEMNYYNNFFSFTGGNSESRNLFMSGVSSPITKKDEEVNFFQNTTSLNNIWVLVENLPISVESPFTVTDYERHFFAREGKIKDFDDNIVDGITGSLVDFFEDVVQTGFTIFGAISVNISFIVPQILLDTLSTDELNKLMDGRVNSLYDFVSNNMKQVKYLGNEKLNNLEVIFISEITEKNSSTKLIRSYIYNNINDNQSLINDKLNSFKS